MILKLGVARVPMISATRASTASNPLNRKPPAMKTRIIQLVIAIGLVIVATMQAAEPPIEAAFKTACQQAFDKKDIKQLESLVHWDRVTPSSKEQWLVERKREFVDLQFLGIELVVGAEKDFWKWSDKGITYQPNLEVTHTLRVKFKDNVSRVQLNTLLPVGLRDGRLFLAGTAPIPK